MCIDIRDANQDPARTANRRRAPLNDDERCIAEPELHTMIANAQAFRKAERAAQPLGSGANIGVGHLRDDRAWRHGTIGQHSLFVVI
jgi:hypothetical protein